MNTAPTTTPDQTARDKIQRIEALAVSCGKAQVAHDARAMLSLSDELLDWFDANLKAEHGTSLAEYLQIATSVADNSRLKTGPHSGSL